MRPRPFDYLAAICALGIVAAAFFFAFARSGGRGQLFISRGAREWIYQLDKDERIEIEGPLGVTVIELRAGVARILSSPCPNHSCVAAGGISKPGQWLACLPNEIFLRIEGKGEDDGVDARSF